MNQLSPAFGRRLRGHIWTIAPFLLGPITQRFPKNRTRYIHEVIDPERGAVAIYGDFYSTPQITKRSGIRILLHGISSTPRSSYLAAHVRAGVQAGYDVLVLALRGALGLGDDHYHAGLTDDLHAVLQDERLNKYASIEVIGCSLGGLMALNFVAENRDSRVKGVVAICPPTDLDVVQIHLDRPAQRVYREAILSGLKRPYKQLWQNAMGRGLPLVADLDSVLKARSFYEWDERVVLPRFGFKSVKAYHQSVSINEEKLANVTTPTLIIVEEADPMIPYVDLNFNALKIDGLIEVCTLSEGGHLGFPQKLNIGQAAPNGVGSQVNAWLNIQARTERLLQ